MAKRILMSEFKSEQLQKLANSFLEESLYWFLTRNAHLVDINYNLAESSGEDKEITDNRFHVEGGLTVTYTLIFSKGRSPVIKTVLKVADGQSNPNYRLIEKEVYLESRLNYLTVVEDVEYMINNTEISHSWEVEEDEVRENVDDILLRIYLQFARQFYK